MFYPEIITKNSEIIIAKTSGKYILTFVNHHDVKDLAIPPTKDIGLLKFIIYSR